MKPELEEHALSIVLRLAESPDAERDGLRSQLCGDDAELGAAVAEFWQAHEDAAPKQFWQRAAPDMFGPSESPAVAQDGDDNAERSSGTQAETPSIAESAIRQQQASAENRPTAGRFQPLELLGKGGQGEVWRALDPELDRHVALKVIKPGLRGSKATVDKFQREAEVTGKLEHPNIVPIYEARERAADGSPYYVMRILQEQSLQTAIDSFHQSLNEPTSVEDYERQLRAILSRFLDVCDAVAYAHSRNVIHRDLKPANVMLGDFGETMVVDWGLAKVLEVGDAAVDTGVRMEQSQEDTAAGLALGTPAYMPPEQARGDVQQMGRTADIYSLGGILYAILAGRSPHVAPADLRLPRLGEHPIQPLIEHIGSGGLLIASPSQVSTRVPKALAAICLKALSPNAADRYQQAASPDANVETLANDIKRWMNDEAVAVYRDPWRKRLQRWSRKNPRTVASAAATVLVATITLTILSAVVNHKNAELDKKNVALDASVKRETTARELAESNAQEATRQARIATQNATVAADQSQLALSTLNSVIFDFNRSFENVPGGTEVRNRLLASVLPQLDKVSTQFARKSAIDRDTMAALIHLADTILQLGETRPNAPRAGQLAAADAVPSSAVLTAERLYQRANTIAKQLAAAAPNDSVAQRDLSFSFGKLGDVFLKLGRTDDALKSLNRKFEIAKTLAEASPDDTQKQRDLSISFERLGDVFLKLGRTDDALPQYQDGLKISRVLAEADPGDAQKQRDLSLSFQRLGDVLMKLGRTSDALSQYQEGLKISRVLAESNPNDAQWQRDLSIVFERLGDVSFRLGRTDDSLTYYQAYAKISRVLAEADPNHSENQRNLSISCGRLGEVFLTLGRTNDALTQFQEALRIRRMLAEADPNDVTKQSDLSLSFERAGDVSLKLGRTADALALFEARQKICRELVKADPKRSENQRNLSISCERLGTVSFTLGRTADALAQFEEGLKISRMLAEADPSDTQKQRDLSIWLTKLGDAFQALGRTDDALTQYQDGLKIRRVLTEADPNDAQNQRDLSISFNRLGDVFLALGRTDEALAQFEAKLKISRALAEADPNDVQKQRDQSVSLERLGNVFLVMGRNDDALSQFQGALNISRVLAEADPNDSQKQRDLSISLNKLGDVFLTLGRTDDALTQYQGGLKLRRTLAEADPRDTQKQRDLAFSFNRLGDVYLKLGRTDDALSQFQAHEKLSHLLATADPKNAEKQRDMMVSQYKQGEAEVQAGRFESAKARFQAGIEVLDRMIANGQTIAAAKQEKGLLENRSAYCTDALLAIGDWEVLLKADPKAIPDLLSIRVTELAKRGQLVEVVRAGGKLRELAAAAKKEQQGGQLYNAACAYALCVTLSAKAQPQPTEVDQAERKKYLDLSLACLKEAVAAGYDNFDHMQKDTDLTPLRELPEFQALLKQRPEKKP